MPNSTILRTPRLDWRRGLLTGLSTLLAVLGLGAGFTAAAARATVISPEVFGVNVRTMWVNNSLQPANLSAASSSGLGTVRDPVNQGDDSDAVVTMAASAHLRLYPELGLPSAESPGQAATDMAQFVTTFAQRYGPNGAFWAQHPELPYLPVERFEIGNEPNMPLQWVADTTHLHWSDPSSYAQVYEASRTALHQVDPSGVAVVGGLGDSASYGVDVAQDEQWLAALTPGAVDAVGYHPYTYDIDDSLMQTDTSQLRSWMDAHGLAGVPIDVNEFDACNPTATSTNNAECQRGQTAQQWAQVVADYTQWAVCTPSLDIQDVQPYDWGATDYTDSDVWMAIYASDQTLTPLGGAYLGATTALTTTGCPSLAPHASSPPSVAGAAGQGTQLTTQAGVWSGSPAPTLSYQWQRCNAAGAACTDISGATSSSYTVQPGDVGATVRVVVTATNANGSASTPSAATAVVTAPTPTATAAKPPASTKSSTPAKTPSAGAKSTASGSAKPTTSGSTKTTDPGSAKSTDPGSAKSTNSGSAGGGGGRPTATATSAAPKLARTQLRVIRVRRVGHRLRVTVSFSSACKKLRVVAVNGSHRHHVTLRALKRSPRHGQRTFTARLATGRWSLVASATVTRGHAVPRPVRRAVTIRP